jgi:hypothetical protein
MKTYIRKRDGRKFELIDVKYVSYALARSTDLYTLRDIISGEIVKVWGRKLCGFDKFDNSIWCDEFNENFDEYGVPAVESSGVLWVERGDRVWHKKSGLECSVLSGNKPRRGHSRMRDYIVLCLDSGGEAFIVYPKDYGLYVTDKYLSPACVSERLHEIDEQLSTEPYRFVK